MDVLYKEIPFKLAIENSAKKHTIFKENRKQLTAVVGCSLRHFYIFSYLINKVRDNYNNEQKAALLVYLSDHLFLNLISSADFEKLFLSLEISQSEINKLNELSKDKEKLIPAEYNKDSIEFLHYRYNTPEWVTKIWMKHFKGYTYKILRANNKPALHYGYVNKSLANKEELINKYREVEDSPFENLIIYNGNVPSRFHPLYKSRQLVSTSPAEDYLLNKLDLDPFRPIVIYSEYKSNLPAQLMSRLSSDVNLFYIAGSSEAYFQTKKDIENYQLNKTQLFETGHSSIITCVANKVSNFFVLPKNTNFQEFRSAPDYFNRLKQDELDGYIANQKEALNDASDFVEDNGNLIYMVPTMNKKESLQIIADFLNSHPLFTLVEQKQFLPFDKYDSTLFIAILRKEAKHD